MSKKFYCSKTLQFRGQIGIWGFVVEESEKYYFDILLQILYSINTRDTLDNGIFRSGGGGGVMFSKKKN